MDYEETMVEQNDEVQADDTPELDAVEEGEPEESLSSLSEDEGQPAQQETQKTESQGTSEPGWIRQRVDKAVQKALAQERESIRAEYEQQFAPLRERLLEMDAQELVRTGKVKDLETAKELVRYRNGQQAQPSAAPRAEQPRQANGQFAPREDQATKARIAMLQHQADRIQESGGPDVIAEFTNNDDIKRKVIAGDMDFYDVAKEMGANKKRKPPAPTRSPNGVNGQIKSTIMAMSDKQFEMLEKKVREGTTFRE